MKPFEFIGEYLGVQKVSKMASKFAFLALERDQFGAAQTVSVPCHFVAPARRHILERGRMYRVIGEPVDLAHAAVADVPVSRFRPLQEAPATFNVHIEFALGAPHPERPSVNASDAN